MAPTIIKKSIDPLLMMVGAMEGFHAGRAREEFTKFLDYENMLNVDIKPA
jgi:hypothetical protein